MIDFEERVMRNHQQKQRDDILREAIKASCDKNGKPDEHLIINYLIDKLILSDELRNFLEFPTT